MSSKPAGSTVRDAMPVTPETDPAAWLRAKPIFFQATFWTMRAS